MLRLDTRENMINGEIKEDSNSDSGRKVESRF
jgi:hypothetical protein